MSSTTSLRAISRERPTYLSGTFEFIEASSFIIFINSRSCLSPIWKSLGSCAGVTFTQPVPNSGSTNLSVIMGISLRPIGKIIYLPTKCLYLSSFGLTATAVSPSIVSGLVVATTTNSLEPLTG